MKNKVCFLLILACVASATMAQQKFIIKGKAKGPAKVFLSYSNGEKYVIDSIKTAGGAFAFSGDIATPTKAVLRLQLPGKEPGADDFENMMFPNAQEFYLGKGTITVSGSDNMRKASIKGGKTQEEYKLLQSQLQPLNDTLQSLQKKAIRYYKEKNEAARQELFPRMQPLRQEMEKMEDSFVYSHPDSYVSLDLVREKAVMIDVPVFEPFFNALSESIRGTKEGKDLAGRLALAKKLDIGRPAIDFTQNDTAGMPISLASLKGKYVLVDFWASWCGPCRSENPNVVKAYQRYKDRNFEIISVSLDSKKEDWLKAIKDDSLTWRHVSDLKGWKNDVAKLYNIQAVPQNLLLDTNGMIIAKNLRGEALAEKLRSIIGDIVPKDSAIVKVRLKNPRNYPVFFPYEAGKKWTVDSSYVMEDGYRVYKLSVMEARIQRLMVRNPDMNIRLAEGFIPGPQFQFLLRGGATVTIDGDADSALFAAITSSDKDIADFEMYESKDRVREAEIWKLHKKMFGSGADTSLKEKLEPQVRQLEAERVTWRKEFVSTYRQRSYAALQVFNIYFYSELNNDEALSMFGSFPEQYKSTPLGRTIKEKLDYVARTSYGQPIVPFRQEGPDGKMVDIAALKGKVVLIDFWGSWCGYCREAHPHLKALYSKYKRKGLEIVGVASEYGDPLRRNEVWKKAIAEDGINWLQVLNDPDGQDLVKLFGVSLFPTKILVDRQGKIVLRLAGDDSKPLDDKLAELL